MVYSPKICCYGSCASRQNARTKTVPGAPGIFFIKFPSPKTDTEKCSRWVNACGRMDFTNTDVKRSTYICSRHFVDFSGPTLLNPDPIANTSSSNLTVCSYYPLNLIWKFTIHILCFQIATNSQCVESISILKTPKRKLKTNADYVSIII